MDDVQTILVPMDFSDEAAGAFRAALRLKTGREATILVLHVLAPERLDPISELGYAMPAEVEARARSHAEQRMRRLVETGLPEGVEVRAVVIAGSPVAEILKLSRELAADLIVLGVGSFFGTVADKIVRASSCPVLVLHGTAVPEASAPPGSEPSGAPSAV